MVKIPVGWENTGKWGKKKKKKAPQGKITSYITHGWKHRKKVVHKLGSRNKRRRAKDKSNIRMTVARYEKINARMTRKKNKKKKKKKK